MNKKVEELKAIYDASPDNVGIGKLLAREACDAGEDLVAEEVLKKLLKQLPQDIEVLTSERLKKTCGPATTALKSGENSARSGTAKSAQLFHAMHGSCFWTLPQRKCGATNGSSLCDSPPHTLLKAVAYHALESSTCITLT